MIDDDTIIPREAAERDAASDPHLRSMIDKGIPLTRGAYLMGAWGGDMPDPWTAEHEAEMPECFRNPDAAKSRPLPRGAKKHQDG